MQHLDLIRKEKSTVNYKIIKYPDSQVSIIVDADNLDKEVVIISRMNSYEDIFLILAATDALKSLGVKDINLFISCFLAQRSDRRFNKGQSFDLKIICDILKAQNYNSIGIYHPHSDILPALLETNGNVRIVTNKLIFKDTLDKLNKYQVKPILISPDAGAYKQVSKLGEEFKLQTISANKNRDLATGDIKLTIEGDVKDKDCLIVDDYCDGGMTFILLAKKLKELGASKVFLLVTHSLFSKSVEPLLEYIDHIYTSFSINDNIYEGVTKL